MSPSRCHAKPDRRRRSTWVAAAVASAMMLSGCGSNVSRDEILQAEGRPVVQQGAVDAPATAGSVPVAAPPVDAPVQTAPQATQSSPGAGATDGPKPGGVKKAPTTSGGPAAGEAPCSQRGADIAIGQVGTFSGVLGASIGGVPAALKAWATATNAAGGIACHNVVVHSVDDGGSAAAAQSAVQDFVQNKRVVAINAFVPLTSAGIRPYIDQQRIPVVGGDVASPPWYSSPFFFPQGPGIDAGLFAAMKFAKQKGKTKFGIVYCIEAEICTSARDAAKNGIAERAGLEYAYEAPVSLTGTNFTQQCAAARSAGVDVLFPALTATGAGAVARDCKQQNFSPTFMTLSLAATDALAADPNLDGTVLGLTVFPWMFSGKPAQANFQAMMKRYAPNVGLSGGVAGAWASGEMLRIALLKLGTAARGTITPALVLQGLNMFKNESVGGLTPDLTFPAGKPAAPVNCAFIAQTANRKWTAPIGDTQVCG